MKQKKDRGEERGDYSRVAIILNILPKGGDYSRVEINRGTAIFQGFTVLVKSILTTGSKT